ncbi:MAG: hypothetical protein WA705_29435 [Candidatus Ozemobacteraceae bacterium]
MKTNVEGIFHHDRPQSNAKRSTTQDDTRFVRENWLIRLSQRFRRLLFSAFSTWKIAAGGGLPGSVSHLLGRVANDRV